MSLVAGLVKGKLQDVNSFMRISQSYFKRRNPIVAGFYNYLIALQEFLVTGKKLKALKYRVRLMQYRIHQMDHLIMTNNPNNLKGGQNLNSLR